MRSAQDSRRKYPVFLQAETIQTSVAILLMATTSPSPKPASQFGVLPNCSRRTQDALRPTNSLQTLGKVRNLDSGSPSQERGNLSSYSIPKVPGHTLTETHLAGRAGGVGSSRIGRTAVKGQTGRDGLLVASVDSGNGVGSAWKRRDTACSECTEALGQVRDSILRGRTRPRGVTRGKRALDNRKVERAVTLCCRRAVQKPIAA